MFEIFVCNWKYKKILTFKNKINFGFKTKILGRLDVQKVWFPIINIKN